MKRLRRVLRTILPPPRRPVTLRQVLLLVLFLVAYFGTCTALVLRHVVLFVRPSMFVLMAFCVWIWWMSVAGYSGLPGRRAGIAFLVRALLVGVFCFALAEPRAVRTSDLLSVVYAIDLSDSIGEGSTQNALQFMSTTVSEKPERDQAGLVVFGRNAAAELPPRQAFPFDKDTVSINSHVDRGATNIEQALSLSAAMLPEENAGRIVLISDGVATEGSLTRILDELKSRDIAVDVVPVQYDYSHEVWLERLDLPRFVKIGDSYEAVIVLSSLQNGSGRLVVREQGRVISEQPVEFRAGKNRYVVPIKLREPGYYEYSATIETPTGADQLKQNNTVLNYLYVKGEGRVMVVRDSAGKAEDWKSLVGALRAEQRLVDIFTAEQFPRDALSLMPYDAVIFVNVAADAFDPVQFKAVHDAVRDLGVGFLMVGGRNSFGPGGYNKTPIEDVLPVTMDITKKKILPKGALVIVLHTCEFPEGNTYAKRVTKEAIRVLGSQDEAGVLAFMGGDSSWVFELTPVSQYDAMVRKINAATPADMPAFQPIMEAGYTALSKSDAAAKHMIVISDGDPAPPSPKLLQDCKAKEITISTVSIYPHGGIEVGTLQAMANLTGGRYYTTNDPDQLPSIFIKEAKSLKRAMVQNKTFTPEIGFPSPILKGLGGLPPLHGYVLTTAKERLTEEVLQAHLPEEESVDPVLARWKFGLGTTAAFTSDLSTNWGADWVGWEGYRAFVKQLMTDIARVQEEEHLRMWAYASGTQGVVVAEDFHPQNMFLEMQAQVSGPQDRSESIALRQIAPRRYQATFPLWGPGRYQLMAIGKSGDRTARTQGGFIVSYSPEYLRFRSNPIVLDEIAEKTGGKVLKKDASADEIYRSRRHPKRSSRPIFDWFLVALACLLPLDVAFRRIQIDRHSFANLFGLGSRKGESTATMGTLLSRKQTLKKAFDAQRLPIPASLRPEGRPGATPSAGTAAPPKPPEGKPTGAKPPEGKTPADESTTSRLLELKRKRQQEGK
ncbi:MAG TPA: VWA domain-containing protein [Planctomycetaceae bacterium]|nr:VWA domain-containing protein [Planctomycetaceae bacterium]